MEPEHKQPRHLVKGRDAESRARRHLERAGLAFVEGNYRCQPGELDLIMREDSVTVFVEVRYRADRSYGGALESIDHRKQSRLRAAAEYYLLDRYGTDNVDCRFDVVLITGPVDGGGDIDWIKNAV